MTKTSDFNIHTGEIESKIGYVFKDKSLLCQAFTRTSYCNEQKSNTGLALQSNEVLEFFGDSVLSAAIVTLFMKGFSRRYENGIYTELKEGDFSNLRSKLSDKKNLSDATRAMGLEKYLRVGEGDEKQGIRNEMSVMEDLFESIIGAIYIDSDYNLKTVIRCVSRMLDINEYAKEPKKAIQSFKNSLQEWCADKKHRLPSPVYKTAGESGPEHKKIYERACYIGDRLYSTGKGKNQKAADAAAAEEALKILMSEYEAEHPKKSEKKPKEKPTEEAFTKLREIAAKEKKPSPEFRDLGESENSTEDAKEYIIECRFKGISALGMGESKREAKLSAAQKIFSELSKDKKKTETNRTGAGKVKYRNSKPKRQQHTK